MKRSIHLKTNKQASRQTNRQTKEKINKNNKIEQTRGIALLHIRRKSSQTRERPLFMEE